MVWWKFVGGLGLKGCFHNFYERWVSHNERDVVATLLLEECEDDIHTLEMGTWESIGTLETAEFDYRGQNTSH
jgi:hypothetical protein